MKSFLKVVAWVIGGLVVLVAAAAVVVPLVVDPNDYKDQIARAVEERTGRRLDIQGDIDLTVFPWLGVRLGTVELGNASGFPAEYMARSESMRVRVKLLSLLGGEVEMDTVVIEGLALNLARNDAGVTNWADIMEKTGAEQSNEENAGDPPPVAALAVGGVKVSDASVTWNDALAGTEVALQDIAIETGPVAAGSPLRLGIEFDIASSEPPLTGHVKASGQIGVDPEAQIVQARDLALELALESPLLPGGKTTVSLAGNAELNQATQAFSLRGLEASVPGLALGESTAEVRLAGDLDGNLAEGRYRAERLSLDGKVSGANVPGGELAFALAAALGLDLNAGTATIEALELASGDLKATGELTVTELLTAPAYQGEIQVATFNPRALVERFGATPPETADPQALTALSLAATVSGTPGSVALDPLAVTLDDTRIEGRVAVPDLATQALRFDLRGDGIDADRYLAPGTEGAATPGAAAPAAGGAPLEQLRALDVDGQLALGRLQVSGLELERIRVGVKAKDGIIRMTPLEASLYGGSYAGSLAVDATGERALISVDEKLSGVQIGRLLAALGVDTGELDLADAAGDLALKAQVAGDPAAQVYDVKGASVRADLTGQGLPGGKLNASAGGDLTLDLGQQTVAGQNVQLSVSRLQLDPKGPLASAKVAAASLDADLAKQAIAASGVTIDVPELKLNPQAKQTSAKLALAKLDADLGQQSARAGDFQLEIAGLRARGSLTASQFLSAPELAGSIEVPPFNARELLASMGEAPETADPQALTSVGLKTTFSASPSALSLSPLAIKLDETSLDGTLEVASFDPPKLAFDLNAGVLNADRYLPPERQGQAASPGAAAAGAAALPMELLRGLDVDGRLKVAKLVLSGLQLTDIQLTVQGKGGIIKAQPLSALLYGGTYAGNLQIDATGQKAKVSVDEKLERVHIGPLLRDLQGTPERVTGRGGFQLRGTATGVNTDEIKRTLNGQAALELRDGAIKGIDILGMLCSGLQSVGLVAPTQGQETKFAALTGTAAITNGVLANRDLELKSPLLRIEGVGTADLVREQLDYVVTAGVVGECRGQGGLGLKELSGLAIPVRISGPFDKPRFQPDYSKLLQQAATKNLQQQLGEKLGIPLPGGQQQQQQQQQQPTLQQQQQQQQQQQAPQKPEDAIKELGEGLLKGLFQ